MRCFTLAVCSVCLVLGFRNGTAAVVGADEQILFSDDFTELRPGWGEAGELRSVSDGRLIINLKPQLIHGSLYRDQRFRDADLRVQVVESSGSNDQPAGLIFWGSGYDDYYVARIRLNGQFSVGRRTRGVWLTPVGLRDCEQVQQGPGAVNELRVVTRGDEAVCYVNGVQVAVLRGYPPANGSMLGLYAESGEEGCTWAFSKLSVRRVPPPKVITEPDPTLLLQDDFGTLDPAWGYASDDKDVRDHKLFIRLRPERAHQLLHQARLYDDADIRLRVAEVAGNEDQPAGIVFWAASHDDCCALLVQANGTLLISRKVKGKWQSTNELDATPLKKGLGQVNELRVVTRGNKATLFANGEEVAVYTGHPPEGGSRIGLHAESGAAPGEWEFSQLIIRQPE